MIERLLSFISMTVSWLLRTHYWKVLSSYKVFSNIFGRILSSIYIELDVLKCFDVLEYTPVMAKWRDMN